MKVFKYTLDIALSDDIEGIPPHGHISNLEVDLVPFVMKWIQDASGEKDLSGYVAIDLKMEEKDV